MKFTALGAVYHKDTPNHFSASLESIINQTALPTQIVLVRDGIVGKKIESIIKNYIHKFNLLDIKFTYIKLKENKGLSKALNLGLEHCEHEYIARFDSDDINLPDRFQKQIKHLSSFPEVDVLGTDIAEFLSDPSKQEFKRAFRFNDKNIENKLLSRCCINHPSVFFKKISVLEAGGYDSPEMQEDYGLWLRMLKNKCKFYQMYETLVLVRIGNGFYGRRNGFVHVKAELSLFMLKLYLFPLKFFFIIPISIVRVILRVLPRQALSLIYKLFLRKK